jgi:hypothetical protein
MSKKIIIFAATNDRTMKKIMLMLMAAVFLTACRQEAQDDKYNITSKFKATYNIYENFTHNDDGSITYNASAYGGLVGIIKERNLPVDWTPYESITFEFAEPTKVETQVLISEKIKIWGRTGITSLTCFFDGLDVRNVSEVIFQTTEPTTITIKNVRLTPVANNWDTRPIWEGECHFGNWENGFVIQPEHFMNAVEGDKIEFIFTTDRNDIDRTYWLFKTIYSGTDMTLEGNYNELNKWGCAAVGRDATHYRIALTANDIANLRKVGLFVNGYYNIVTKVNLVRKLHENEDPLTENQ